MKMVTVVKTIEQVVVVQNRDQEAVVAVVVIHDRVLVHDQIQDLDPDRVRDQDQIVDIAKAAATTMATSMIQLTINLIEKIPSTVMNKKMND